MLLAYVMPHVWIPLETVVANSTDYIVEPFSVCQPWYEHDQCFAHGLTSFADSFLGLTISHTAFVCDNRYSQFFDISFFHAYVTIIFKHFSTVDNKRFSWLLLAFKRGDNGSRIAWDQLQASS